jgi:Tol biopolymer transport system component
VREDGLKRHLGDFQQATWSPRGRYVAATRAHELFALEPDGDLRWSLSHPARVHDPAWSQSGFRIAYLAGDSLRVVAGDGTGDRVLDPSVLARTPAWRPPVRGALASSPTGVGTHQVAYVDRSPTTGDGELVRLVDTDTGRTLWTRRANSYVIELAWSRNGERLLVTTAAGYEIYGRRGGLVVATGGAQNDAAISPDGERLAVSQQRKGHGAEVFVRDAGTKKGTLRKVFSGPGVLAQLEWSANGRWLLVAWPTADQLLFLRDHGDRVISVGRIKDQFQVSTGFPEVAGWCCAAGSG